jgi:hypothetical protein
MNADDFTASAPGRLVKASGVVVGEHLAFIPDALPPHRIQSRVRSRDLQSGPCAYVDAPMIEGRWKASHPTALKILMKTTQLGFISEVSGRRRAQLFRADSILDVLK